ncbi:AAA family ATPase [Pseudoalteromonas sp. NZS11_1]|uniref:AAA family ATPase n=1 Tax=Pseudoalteromonas sp. NZS11_1 TaxID=2792070 RepID=UPI0018CEEFA8|nr:AAA family ATPase [Pseudoalteromonas sp. NZS11_1]MBH0044877.1 AAA family ATPase [Pseudoalteromonas sp. NZS11_1]
MSFNNVVGDFFHGKKVTYNEQVLDYAHLSGADSLIPFILTILNWSLKDTVLDNKLVTFELTLQEDSLFGFEAKNITFHHPNCVNLLLTSFPMYEVMGSLLPNDSLCITKFVTTHRYESKHAAEEGDTISVEQVVSYLFSEDYDGKAPLPALYKTIRLFDKETHISSSVDTIKHTPPPPFDIKKHYSSLSKQTRELFDEITIVSTANYLLKNSDMSISNNEYARLKLDSVSPDIFFSAILSVPFMLETLAAELNCFHYQVIFPQPVYDYRENIEDVVDVRTFDSEKGNTTNWYGEAKRPVFNLRFNPLIESSLNKAFDGNVLDTNLLIKSILEIDNEFINELKAINNSKNRSVKSLKTSQIIQEALSNRIIGQKKAMEGIAQGYLSSCLHRSEGPRMIYTFAGPSGVGKTYSATRFAELLNDVESSGYGFNVFNMEHFTHEHDTKKLVGSGNQYTDASLGLLTNLVRINPRQVLLFDEVEKAHPNVIQSLLTILDSGYTEDATSLEEIDFTQSIIIFTTNLGQELFNKNNQHHQVNVFDVLRTSKNGQTGQSLAPEFVNRLSKGYSALFSGLKVNHFIKAVEKVLIHDTLGMGGITFKWPESFSRFLLKSLAPEITMRQIEHSLPEIQANILQKSISHLDEEQSNIFINVNVSDNLAHPRQNVFLVLDDDKRVCDAINQSLSNESITLCANKSDIPPLLEKLRPQSLLIDVDSLDANRFAELVDEMSSKNPELILFSYQLISDSKKRYSANHEEVREHFSLDAVSVTHALVGMFKRINFYIDTEYSLTRMCNQNQMLKYNISVEKSSGDIEVTFHDLNTQQLIYSNDLRESDFFSQSAPTDKLSDVIGLERAKNRLNDVIGWLKQPSKLNNFGISVPAGYLFAGPPGTGKTLLARAVAGECDLPFFSVSAAELSASHHGGTTQNIKKLFSTARKYAPAIVFIDEIDAIAAARTAGTSGAAQDANQTVNALLTEMDGFDDKCQIFVLAATNHPEKLDRAITRPGRFDETIYCDLPNKEARTLFFTQYASQHNLYWTDAELLNLVALSQRMSPAEIQQVLKEAIQFAVSNDVQLSKEIIEKTMIRVRYGSPSEHLFLSGDEKRKTAYHEAGHLVAHHLLFPKQHIDFITIEPRNQALGFVATRQPDEYESYSKITIMRKLQMLLAGRVAEKLCTGSADEISTGASNDIEKATQLAMHAVYQGGIEPSVGPLNVGLLTRFEESDLLANAQNAVKRWIETAEKEVEELLIEHYSLLEVVAEKLIDEESLMGHQILTLLGDA